MTDNDLIRRGDALELLQDGLGLTLTAISKRIAALPAASPEPEVTALVYAAKGLLFAHDHGQGLEGWHETRERMRAALAAWEKPND